MFDSLVGFRRSALAALSLGALTFAIVFLLGGNASALANGSCASGNTHVCSLRAWAYLGGNMPVAGGDVRVLAPRIRSNEARAAAVVKVDPSKGANAVLGDLLKRIEKAADLGGPKGVAFGLAMAGIKGLLSLSFTKADQEEEDEVKLALKQISNQIANLHEEVKNSVFNVQLEFLKRDISEIKSAQIPLTNALDQNVGTPAGKRDFPQFERSFIAEADKLRNMPTKLHDALATTSFEGAPSVLASVRQKIGREPIFTHKSSERIRTFFKYYEWWETELAIVLSEFYNLQGQPAVALSTVKLIQQNLSAQRALLPPRDLAPSVFIDTKTKLMWKVDPEFASTANIVASGFSACSKPVTSFGGYSETTCEPNAKAADFAGLTGWSMPTADQAKGLFADRGGEEPVGWLEKAGVTFHYQRVPGWQNLDSLISLWLRNKFTFKQQVIRGRVTYSRIHAEQLVLKPGKEYRSYNGAIVKSGSEVAPLTVVSQQIAGGCIQPAGRLRCDTDPRTSGYILWVRPLKEEGPVTAREHAQYW